MPRFYEQILNKDLFSMGSTMWVLSVRDFREKTVLYGSTTTSEGPSLAEPGSTEKLSMIFDGYS
jgi:hypothetical protein